MAAKADVLVGLCVAAVGVAFFIGAETIAVEAAAARDVGSRFVPRLASALIAVLALLLVVNGLRERARGPWLDAGALGVAAVRVLPLAVAALVFVPMVHLAGYTVATILATLAALLLFGNRRWWVLLAVPIGLALLIDHLFFDTMQLYRPEGLLPGLIAG